MAELEKKISDFQVSECEEQVVDQPIVERLCPECIPNPNFKLEDKWYNIKKAYLDESVCEYRVRIYGLRENGVEKRTKEEIKSLGIDKIIISQNKVLNNESRGHLERVAYFSETRMTPRIGATEDKLGKAYLVSVPAITVDQLPDSSDESGDQDQQGSQETATEILIDFKDLNTKLIQIAGALRIYGIFYANANYMTQKGVTIRYKDHPLNRFSYERLADDVKLFRTELSDELDNGGFVELFEFASMFKKARRPKTIKLIFDENGQYKLTGIYVHAKGCEEYEKLNIADDSPLLGSSLKSVYYLMDNLDQVINDITAQETKPWLEFTLDNIYPEVVVDYGEVSEFSDEDYAEFGCLLENSFGVGKGQLANSMYKNALSFFKSLENELYKSACRSINESSTRSNSMETLNLNIDEEDVQSVYDKEYDRLLDQLVKVYNENYFNEDIPDPSPTPNYQEAFVVPDDENEQEIIDHIVKSGETMYGIARKYGVDIEADILDYNTQFDINLLGAWNRGDFPAENDRVGNENRNPNWIYPGEVLLIGPPHVEPEIIEEEPTETEVKVNTEKATRDNILRLMTLSDPEICLYITYKNVQYQVCGNTADADIAKILSGITSKKQEAEGSPYKGLIKEAWNEEVSNSNGLIGLMKGGKGKDGTEFEGGNFWLTSINIIGLCGISKLSSKALECLLGGTSINQFYDAMIEKFFEFLELNTLDLFLNNLPYSFRTELNQAIEKEFGGASITELLNIKKQDNQKVRDVVNYGATNQLFKIFEKDIDPLKSSRVSQADKRIIENNLGTGQFYDKVVQHYKLHYWFSSPSWPEEEEDFIVPSTLGKEEAESKSYKPKKYAKKLIKHGRRQYLKGNDNFQQSQKKLTQTLDLFGERQREGSQEKYNKELNRYERTSKAMKQSNIGASSDAVFDIIFDFAIDYMIDSLSIDFLVEQISKYPAGEWLVGFVTDFFKSCPHPSLFQPPVKDFMKSFSLDVCDPEVSFTMPKLQVSNISLRYNIDKKFGEVFSKSILDLYTQIVVGLIKRLVNLLEDALCKSLEAIGRFAENGIKDNNLFSGALNNFQNALDTAFCGGNTNPDTGRSRAEELAENLFKPFMEGNNPLEGMGDRVSNIISGVASQAELLELIVDGNEDTAAGIANAISELEPSMADGLGYPSQVGYFFENLRSYLSDEDKQRIRDLLDSGIPNLPTSASICLTNEQLAAWDNVRRAFFEDQGMTPEEIEQAIRDYNNETEDALDDLLDDIGEINSEGPFLGALSNQALADLCNPNNVFNTNSRSSADQEESDELTEDYYNNILRMLMIGFFNPRSGVLSNALRDTNNATQIKRKISMFFNPNYKNSVEEQKLDYEQAGAIRTFVKNALGGDTNEEGTTGTFPETVGGYLRDQLLENKKSLYPIGFSLQYEEGEGSDYFTSLLTIDEMNRNGSFDHDLNLRDTFGTNYVFDSSSNELFSMNITIPVDINEEEEVLLNSLSIYPSMSSDNLRYTFFENTMNNHFPLENKNYENFYNSFSDVMVNGLIEASVTNEEWEDKYPLGFKYGYVSEDLAEEDFKYLNKDGTPYDKDEDEQILGKYGSDRIKVLNPEIYGGRYSNPPITIEPPKYFGWIEFALKAFESREGCDPKNPPILGMQDIKNRVKFLDSSLRDYPELTEDPECINEIPFKLLVDSKVRANIDGVVRSTLRTYLAEAFFKSSGVFSNVQFRRENLDRTYMLYFTEMMKRDMLEMGTSFVNSSISIKKEKYWYAFLEQVVQVYQNMIDLGEATPSPKINKALEDISLAQGVYGKISRETRKSVVNNAGETFTLPTIETRNDFIKSPEKMAKLGIYFKLVDQEGRDAITSGGRTSLYSLGITKGQIKRFSIKKLNFFSKMSFIAMFEEECQLILSELLLMEAERIGNSAFNGLNDKPYIYDLNKSFVGLRTIFADSTSRVGLNSYYIEKQLGTADVGSIQQVNTSITSLAKDNRDDSNKVQLVVEGYARIIDRESQDLPTFITNRPESLVGVTSPQSLKNYLDQNSSALSDKYVSEYFGTLEFKYQSSFTELYNSGFLSGRGNDSMQKLKSLNPEINPDQFSKAYYNLVAGLTDYEDFQVFHDSSFLLEGSDKEPVGTFGEAGIKYGIRICAILPDNTFTDQEIETMKQDPNFINKSRREKAFLFEDNKVMVPIVSTEVDVVDCRFSELNPFSGKHQYDLECLVNKLVEQTEFKMFFNKIFPIKTYNSAAAIFCCHNFMTSLGRGEGERGNDVEIDVTDEWDGTSNSFVKNFMRREFASLYLANSVDGFGAEPLSERERLRLLESFNPFGAFALPSIRIPWFKRRRIETKVYDANGMECADPLKDLE